MPLNYPMDTAKLPLALGKDVYGKAIIADLDRPREGLLQVSQQAMIDVQKSMQPTQLNQNRFNSDNPSSY